MYFTCAKCNRPLTKANNWHYCHKTNIADLFANKPAALKSLYDKLEWEVKKWPGVRASAAKSCIVFVAHKTFLVVKVMKKELDLKFVLPHQTDAFPVYKTAAYGKKLEHYIRLADAADFDNDVIWLLQQSYNLVSGNE